MELGRVGGELRGEGADGAGGVIEGGEGLGEDGGEVFGAVVVGYVLRGSLSVWLYGDLGGVRDGSGRTYKGEGG